MPGLEGRQLPYVDNGETQKGKSLFFARQGEENILKMLAHPAKWILKGRSHRNGSRKCAHKPWCVSVFHTQKGGAKMQKRKEKWDWMYTSWFYLGTKSVLERLNQNSVLYQIFSPFLNWKSDSWMKACVCVCLGIFKFLFFMLKTVPIFWDWSIFSSPFEK